MGTHGVQMKMVLPWLVPWAPRARTAKTQYRKFETNIPRKESGYIHVSVSDLYSSDRSAYSAAGKLVGRTWEYIDRSQTHECGNWD
jgi:hypothetical protein